MTKTNLLYLGLIALLVLSLGSCTIEKRLYKPGYHVEWFGNDRMPDNKSISQKETPNEQPESEIAQESTLTEPDNSYVPHNYTDEGLSASANEKSIVLPKKEKNHNFSETDLYASDKMISPLLIEDDEKDLRINHAALLGLLMAALSLSGIVIFSLVGIGLCISALHQIKAEPHRWKSTSKNLAILGLIANIAIIALVVFVVLAFFGIF